MLQVWKIAVPSISRSEPERLGWALAESAEEVRTLAGEENAIVQLEPERLWIMPNRLIWEK